MHGDQGRISGYLLSGSGDLVMNVRPLDESMKRSSTQLLKFNLLKGSTIETKLSWEQSLDSSQQPKRELYLDGQRLDETKNLVLNYTKNGECSAMVYMVIASIDMSIPYPSGGKTLKLSPLDGLEAADGKQLVYFDFEWKDQDPATVFEIVFVSSSNTSMRL